MADSASNAKLASILTFLDEAENNIAAEEQRAVAAPALRAAAGPGAANAATLRAGATRGVLIDPSPHVTQLRGAAQAGTQPPLLDAVRGKLAVLKTEAAAKDARIAELQGELADARAALAAQQAVADSAAAAAKAEFDGVAQRQLQFIQKLIADKEELSQQQAGLAREVAQVTASGAAKLEAAMKAAAAELKRQKDAWAVAERARREQWEAERTASIKQLTIKGLEPEINRLMERHKKEIERSTALHQEVRVSLDCCCDLMPSLPTVCLSHSLFFLHLFFFFFPLSLLCSCFYVAARS
jgi:hypothetical protein